MLPGYGDSGITLNTRGIVCSVWLRVLGRALTLEPCSSVFIVVCICFLITPAYCLSINVVVRYYLLCVLGWGLEVFLPYLSPSSRHCPARGWPPDRLSRNCRRAYGWVERCSCPVSRSGLFLIARLMVHFGCFMKWYALMIS